MVCMKESYDIPENTIITQDHSFASPVRALIHADVVDCVHIHSSFEGVESVGVLETHELAVDQDHPTTFKFATMQKCR